MKNSLLILLSMFSLMISAQDLYLHCGKLIDTENVTFVMKEGVVYKN